MKKSRLEFQFKKVAGAPPRSRLRRRRLWCGGTLRCARNTQWRKGMRFKTICLALCLTASSFITHPVAAQTMSFGDSVELWAQACRADVEKSCKSIRPGSGKLASCLQAKGSSSCKSATAAFITNMEARLAAEQAAPELCAFDVKQFCASQGTGQARKLHCLMRRDNFRRLTTPCKQALQAAGWLDQIATKVQ